jgi:16S rRNA (guanine1516-N2)-methyltransferase
MSRDQLLDGIRAEALEPSLAEAAAALADRLDLRQVGEAGYALQVGSQGLQFVELGAHAPGPVRVDFVAGAAAHRTLYGGGLGQTIAKAVGIRAGVRPIIVDATAGLGRDAFVLAGLGCAVTMIERQRVVAALLEDGLQRALADPVVARVVARMQLICGDSIALLQNWQGMPPQVVYLDPMFPKRDKSALVKKEMRLFRPLAGADDDAPELLKAAIALATHRVVVKRPRKAPAIAGDAPGYVLTGKSSRFDIYPKRSLTPRVDPELSVLPTAP